ncbi:hypothetical protein WJX74_005513 [Apatococcus lobatus]|uniref:Uncharacterized protein n=1 Tax=Apatococcus lobatus TaxID=904363 RepID=A0AAW1SGK7_9CHLO
MYYGLKVNGSSNTLPMSLSGHAKTQAPFGRTLDGPNTVAKEDQPAKPAGARQAGKQQRVQRVQTSQDAPCPNLRNLSTQGSGGSTSRRGFGFLRLSK